jgi:tetratricopeptide (TPR) repeat protein
MIGDPAALQERLAAAGQLLQARRPADAARLLGELLARAPDRADARRLLAVALRDLGDLVGAERELRAAIALDPRQPASHGVLADVLTRAGRSAEAEAAYRSALALDPRFGPAAVGLADLLLAAGRAEAALAAIEPATRGAAVDVNVWTAQGQALKGLLRLDEAAAAFARAAQAAPLSGVAEHNLAAILGDRERFAESEQATRRAFAKGLDAPETWLVHGRALLGQARLDEAEDAYRQALRRRPGNADMLSELAQLIWMRSEDLDAACAPIDEAIRAAPAAPGPRLAKAKLLEYAGDAASAYAELAQLPAQVRDTAALHVRAAQLLSALKPERALEHAERAVALAPGDVPAEQTLIAAHLAAGQPDAAATLAAALHQRVPLDQHVIGLMVTAWRLLGDARAAAFSDYDALVRAAEIDVPPGWSSLDAYLADLAEALRPLHPLRAHPLGQSLRGGTQTLQGLDQVDDPVIKAFFTAIDGPIRRYMAALGSGDDPLRRRNTGAYRLNGVWSVRLRPRGRHADHLHPMGWISSACYICVPPAVQQGREGWLKFGESGLPTRPALEPDHFVKPAPGRLALFPSYLWHGTIPFGGEQPRLTIAFDVVPA